MSKLDDIQAKLDAKMDEIMRRIDAGGASVSTPAPAPTPQTQSGASTFASPGAFTRPMPAAPAAVANAWPPPPGDDSSQPTLSEKDLYALAPFDIYVVGLKPGDPYPYEGKRYPGDPGNPEDGIWENVVAAARQADVILGSCELSVDGEDRERKKLFRGPTLFCRDSSETPSSIQQFVHRNVSKAVAYYLAHWGYRDIQDICILWALVGAKMDSSYTVRSIGYGDNAFSLGACDGMTILCFSPVGDHTGLGTTSHEFTHSVTDLRIGWGNIYQGETGALNESFSDIFAKFAEWAWDGRQLSDPKRWIYSGCRDMAHPERLLQELTVKKNADGQEVPVVWIAASYYLQGCERGYQVPREYVGRKDIEIAGGGWFVGDFDRGGVHLNNGVIARLCYLLCEGETFNRDDGRSFDVKPIGFARTEELFGTLLFGQRRYLPSACNMYAFYNGITLAAQDLGFSQDERDRLLVACDAVNIVPKQSSSKFGNLPLEGFSMRSAIPGMPRRPYTKVLAEALSGELGLHVAGAGCAVDEESVVELPDLHAAVPTGGEVQVTFSQTWNGLPVFGSYAIARVRDGDRITHLQNGFSSALGQLTAKATADESAARRTAESEFPGSSVSSVRKVVFDPALLGRAGVATVAWQIDLQQDDVPAGMCMVSTTDGSVLYRVSARIVD